MTLIADMLLLAGALGAGFYCYVLSRRLRRFTDLEKGVGGAVAVLSVQVDDLTKSLKSARSAASGSVANLNDVSDRAEAAARRLEMLIASLHDLPPSSPTPPPAQNNPFFVRTAVHGGKPQ